MSRLAAALLAAVMAATFVTPVAADESEPIAPAPTEGDVVPGEVIVKYVEAEGGVQAAEADGLEVVAELGSDPAETPLLVSTEGQPVDQVLAELNADPAVEYAEPNYVVSLAADPTPEPAPDLGDLDFDDGTGQTMAVVAVNDPKTSGQYSLDRMQVRSAWALSTGGNRIIAVIDTGVQFNHPDLVGRLLPGHDFVNDDTNASDDQGHGTWVSGIIAANANDGYGIAGISWTDKILPVKTMDHRGLGNTSDLTSGIVWAADHGATVINLSVGGFPYSRYVQDAVNYAWSKGAVIIGAAGNNRREETYYPASYTNVVSVSATQPDDEFANWSSYGSKVDVSAPGASILTSNCTTCNTWGSHVNISGTSFATPNTAGVVALIRAKFPNESPAQIVNRLTSSVDDQGYAGWDNRYGLGRVNAARALGGGVSASGVATGDGMERNNTIGTARTITLGATTRPSIHPAGDVDVFAVDVPRAGRLDVRVTGVVDTARVVKSSLPIDPIVEIYSSTGTLLLTVDKEWESGTELASRSVTGPTRLLIRIRNYYANGSRAAYTLTPTFVDNVAPTLTARSPAPGATGVRFDSAKPTVNFSEYVTGISPSTLQLTASDGTVIPATVAATSRSGTLTPSRPLAPETTYTLAVGAGIKDAGGNSVAPATWTFTTGKGAARVYGADRYATAAALSQATYAPGVAVVFIATGAVFPDALSGAPAAAVGGGPILFADGSGLPAATRAELMRLKPSKIVVLGGPSAVSSSTLNDLKAYTAGGVTRLFGDDRYGTSAAISAATFAPGAPLVFVATGATYADGLAAGAVAAREQAPLLLTRPNELPSEIAAELARLTPARIVVMGGPSAVSDSVLGQLRTLAPEVLRVAGADRYGTAAALSAMHFGANSVSTVYIATGRAFPDGLSAGPVAAAAGSPLLLVSRALPPETAAELRRLDPTNVVILGGPSAVSEGVRNAILALWE